MCPIFQDKLFFGPFIWYITHCAHNKKEKRKKKRLHFSHKNGRRMKYSCSNVYSFMTVIN